MCACVSVCPCRLPPPHPFQAHSRSEAVCNARPVLLQHHMSTGTPPTPPSSTSPSPPPPPPPPNVQENSESSVDAHDPAHGLQLAFASSSADGDGSAKGPSASPTAEALFDGFPWDVVQIRAENQVKSVCSLLEDVKSSPLWTAQKAPAGNRGGQSSTEWGLSVRVTRSIELLDILLEVIAPHRASRPEQHTALRKSILATREQAEKAHERLLEALT